MSIDYANLHYTLAAKFASGICEPIPDIHGEGEWSCVTNKQGVMIVFTQQEVDAPSGEGKLVIREPKAMPFYVDSTWHRIVNGVIVEVSSLLATGNTTVMFQGEPLLVSPVCRAINSAIVSGAIKEDDDAGF